MQLVPNLKRDQSSVTFVVLKLIDVFYHHVHKVSVKTNHGGFIESKHNRVSYDGARITTKKLADCGTHHALIKSFSSLTGAATGAASLVLFPIPVPTAVIIVKQQNCCDCLSEMCLSFTNKQLQKSAIISKVV